MMNFSQKADIELKKLEEKMREEYKQKWLQEYKKQQKMGKNKIPFAFLLTDLIKNKDMVSQGALFLQDIYNNFKQLKKNKKQSSQNQKERKEIHAIINTFKKKWKKLIKNHDKKKTLTFVDQFIIYSDCIKQIIAQINPICKERGELLKKIWTFSMKSFSNILYNIKYTQSRKERDF